MNAARLMTSIESWPVWVGVAVLVVAAITFARSGRVPNWFSYAAMIGAWVVAGSLTGPGHVPSLDGSLGASLGCTAAAFGILFLFYAQLGLGAGCVKAQMAFAAWVGAGMASGPALLFVGGATLLGVIVTVLGMWLYRLRRPLDSDAHGDDDPWPEVLFPAQITLTLGSTAGVVVMFVVAAGRIGN